MTTETFSDGRTVTASFIATTDYGCAVYFVSATANEDDLAEGGFHDGYAFFDLFKSILSDLGIRRHDSTIRVRSVTFGGDEIAGYEIAGYVEVRTGDL